MLETPQDNIAVVAEVAGEMQAEMLRSLLEAQGISAVLSEESTARTLGISLPGLGLVQVLVRADQAEAAQKILDDYEQGNLENDASNVLDESVDEIPDES